MIQTLTRRPSPLENVIALEADEIELVLTLALDRSEDGDTRARAVEDLAQLNDPHAGAACLALLDDPSVEVRFWAVYSLWQLAAAGRVELAPTAAALHRVGALDDGVVPGWWSVRKEALDALVALGLLVRPDAECAGFERHRLDELRFARSFAAAAALADGHRVEIANEVRVARRDDVVAISFPWLTAWRWVEWDGSAAMLTEIIEDTASQFAAKLPGGRDLPRSGALDTPA